MTPDQFKTLREGDVIRHRQSGRGFTVIKSTGFGSILVQSITSLGALSAPDFTLAARVTAYSEPPTPAPAPEPLKCPPDFVMTRELFDAGYVRVEHKTGYKWQSPSKVDFATIEVAWINLKSPSAGVQFGVPARVGKLQEARASLFNAGWRCTDCGNSKVWRSPTGFTIRGSLAAHAAMVNGQV